MADFLTDDCIVEYFKKFNPNFTIDLIPSYVRSSAYQQIINKTGSTWDTTTKTILENGTGSPFLSLRECPIVVDSMIILNHRDSSSNVTLDVDQTSDDKDIVYNADTGMIELLNLDSIFTETYRVNNWGYDQACFPKGLQNIQITGSFGSDANVGSILKQLQLYIMTGMMSRMDPMTYGKGDIVSEKIGKYQYELYGRSQTKSERPTISQIIDDLYSLLPGSICWGDI